ncbi:MAG: L-ribulose-5-phosphate 4-epimerase [Clostridiales bacterium]|nr:L-ribulose-5-phosphate 4-epimerase [Clostridiales bacterium]
MLEQLKKEVCAANLKLVEYNLVTLTWGNVSAISDDRKYIVIKPSGVDYEKMHPAQMVVTDMDGNVVEGDFQPSSDLLTHLELYHHFKDVKGVVHTHSRYATALAQSERELPCYGTTHADHFYGSVPCSRHLSKEEIESEYELNTGKVIVETFQKNQIDPLEVPAVLVCKHGPFTWGNSVNKAVENALVLEETAHMALITQQFNPDVTSASQDLQDKHYFRKHGESAYYGQEDKSNK